MRTEIPACKRCCFCLPLRYGLIVWGYLRLGISIALLIFLGFLWHAVFTKSLFTTRDCVFSGIATIVTIADFVLSLVFIIGCYKKNVKLMQTFYFYSLILFGLTTALTIYFMGIMIADYVWFTYLSSKNLKADVLFYGMGVVADSLTFFSHLFLQSYMLLLVRSEMIKLNNGCQFRFVNHADQSQCTLDVTILPTQHLPIEDNETEAC